MDTDTQSFTTQSALATLLTLRDYLVSTGDLTKGYELAFKRVIQRLNAKEAKERLSIYGAASATHRHS